jgi:hypothetical protein
VSELGKKELDSKTDGRYNIYVNDSQNQKEFNQPQRRTGVPRLSFTSSDTPGVGAALELDGAMTQEQRFWSKVDKRGPEECWPWMGAIRSGRYGVTTGRNRYAHRQAWEFANGPIPAGLDVCHHCDNMVCCNPAHLFTGTAKDNAADMMRKGRGRYITRRGEDCPTSKLTWFQVDRMRERYDTGTCSTADLARDYGVNQKTAWKIVRRQAWTKH